MRILSAVTAIAASVLMTSTALAVPFGDPVERGDRIRTSDLTMDNPLPPSDIYRPGPSRGPWHTDLASFAWREFIALVAPAGDTRGQPNGSFSESGCFPNGPLVWETYQHRSEQFPFNGGPQGPTPPQPWNDPPKYIFNVGGNVYDPSDDIDEPVPYNNLDEVTQIGQNRIFLPGDPTNQILFEAKVNQVSSDFFRDNQSLDVPFLLPEGTIEVKAAWIPLDTIPESQQHRYHTSEAIFYEGEDNNIDDLTAVTATFALLGLHIIHKTPNYPTFIFATFEHKDLLRDPETREPTGLYYIPTYDDIEYTTPETTDLSVLGLSNMAQNPNIPRFNINRPRAWPNGIPVRLPVGDVANIPGATVDNGDVLIPVRQPPTTNLAVAWVNWKVHRAMKRIPCFDENFIWQYYKLKGVQGVPTSNEKSKDYYLANIVIESSQPGVQLFRGGITRQNGTFINVRNQANVVDPMQGDKAFSVGGCQGCHGIAQTKSGTDFSFLGTARNGRGFSPDTADEVLDSEEADRIDDYAQPTD